MNKKVIFSVLSAIYVLVLLIGAFSSNVGETLSQPGFDKIVHFFGFFVLSLLLFITLKFYKVKNNYIIAFTASLLIGVFIELVQLLIPNRSFSFLDILADLLGIIIALVLVWSFSKR